MKLIQIAAKNGYVYLLLYTLFFILCIYRGVVILDPDFGWILRMGKIILERGIPEKDPFSYTMSSYPFIAHQWLSEAIIAYLYRLIGGLGLAAVFAFFVVFSLFISVSRIAKAYKNWLFVPLFLAICLLADFVSVRPQIFSWVLFSVLIKLLFSDFKHKALLTPIIFLGWVNLHGGFAAGFIILFLITACEVFENKRAVRESAVTLALSFLATIINPYGLRVWQEPIMTITDRTLSRYIVEWQSAVYISNFLFWIYLSFSAIFIVIYRRTFKLSEKVVFVFLLFSALSSKKQIPLFVLFSLPLLVYALSLFYAEAKKIKFGAIRFKRLYRYLSILVITLYIPFLIVLVQRLSLFKEEKFYPVKAVELLQEEYPGGRIFTLYEWSGYINWKLPKYKIFINGMMSIWRGHEKPNESPHALVEYRDILIGKKSFKDVIRKYGITTVLLPIKDNRSGDYSRLKSQTISEGLSPVYKDNSAILYQK